MFKERIFTDEEIQYLKDNYANTKNKYIRARLGIGNTLLHRTAIKLGLKKRADYATVFSKKVVNDGRLNNRPTQEAIENSQAKHLKRLNDKEYHSWWRKRCSDGVNKLIKAEKRRVMFGLEQKSNRKVTKAPPYKTRVRTILRRHGYVIERGSNIAYYNEEIIRDLRKEELACKYGIKIEKI